VINLQNDSFFIEIFGGIKKCCIFVVEFIKFLNIKNKENG